MVARRVSFKELQARLLTMAVQEVDAWNIMDKFIALGKMSSENWQHYLHKVTDRIYADPMYRKQCDKLKLSDTKFKVLVIDIVTEMIKRGRNYKLHVTVE